MKRVLYLAGPVGMAFLVIGSGWAVLADRLLPWGYRSLIVLGLVLVVAGVWGRRDQLLAQSGKRKALIGAGTLAAVALSAAILLLVNFTAVRYQQRWDLTRNKTFSLHPATLRVLGKIDRDVDVYGFLPETDMNRSRETRGLYGLFSFHQPRIHTMVIDPTKNPDIVAKVGVNLSRVTVVVSGDRKVVFPGFGESELTAALLQVGRSQPRVIYWVMGHGEREADGSGGAGFRTLKSELEKNYFQVKGLSLAGGEQVPEDASLLLFADPRRPLPAAEAEAYDAWLRKGHRMLVLTDVEPDQAPNAPHPLANLLENWGLRAMPAVALDPRSRTGEADPRFIVGDNFTKHPAVDSLNGMRVVMPMARPIEMFLVMSDQQIFHHALVRAGKEGATDDLAPFATTDLRVARENVDLAEARRSAVPGDVTLAMTAFRRWDARDAEKEAGRETRIVLVGDTDMFQDRNIDREANREFALNLVRWLTGEELLIRRQGEQLMAKQAMSLEPAQQRMVFGLVLGVPVTLFFAGWIVWFMRRSK